MPADPNTYTIKANVEQVALNTGKTTRGSDYHDVTLYDEDNGTRESYRFFGEADDLVLKAGEVWECSVSERLSGGTVYFNLQKVIQKIGTNGATEAVSAPPKPPATKPGSRPNTQAGSHATIDLRERATNARTSLMQAVAYTTARLNADPVLAATPNEEFVASGDVMVIALKWGRMLDAMTEGRFDGDEE